MRAFVAAHALWLGVGAIAIAATAFLLHQLMAWPPHEDETLALFVGRDSLGGCDRARDPRARRRAAPLPVRLCGRPPRRSASAASASSPPPSPSAASRSIALLGRRLADRSTALIATALVAGSWVLPLPRRLRPDVQPLPVPLAALVRAPAPRARPRNAGAPGRLWGVAILLAVASHPYGALVLAAQGVFVLVARRDRLRQAIVAFAAVVVVGTPFWLTDLVLAGRFDVGVGGRGAKLGGPWAVVTYLWQTAGDFSSGRLARPRRRPRCSRSSASSRVRAETRALALCAIGVPVAAFLAARARRLDLARVAPPHLRAPVLRGPRRRRASSAARAASLRRPRSAHRRPRRARGRAGPGTARPSSSTGSRTSGRRRGPRPSASSPRRAAPTTFSSATSRSTSARGSATASSPTSSLPRADAALALAHARAAQPKPLGRGVWILDASERNNLRPRLEIENRDPGPRGLFEPRVFGPFLILRTRAPLGTEDAYLAAAARAMLVGRSLGIGDADVNMQTIERADRVAAGLRPVGAPALRQLAVAGGALEGAETGGRLPPPLLRGRSRRAAAAAEAPRSPPMTSERTFRLAPHLLLLPCLLAVAMGGS